MSLFIHPFLFPSFFSSLLSLSPFPSVFLPYLSPFLFSSPPSFPSPSLSLPPFLSFPFLPSLPLSLPVLPNNDYVMKCGVLHMLSFSFSLIVPNVTNSRIEMAAVRRSGIFRGIANDLRKAPFVCRFSPPNLVPIFLTGALRKGKFRYHALLHAVLLMMPKFACSNYDHKLLKVKSIITAKSVSAFHAITSTKINETENCITIY